MKRAVTRKNERSPLCIHFSICRGFYSLACKILKHSSCRLNRAYMRGK